MFGLSKFQLFVVAALIVLLYHNRAVFENIVADATKFVTPSDNK